MRHHLIRLGTVAVVPVALCGALAAAALPASAAPSRAHAAAVTGRIPGTPVTPLPQVNKSVNGGDNTSLGEVPATAVLGTPDPGVVPVLGNASATAADGAYVAYETRVNARTVDLMISSPALAGAVPVRVFLPRGYTPASTATYPSLLLLPGASEKADYQAWSLYTDVFHATARTRALVVMPSLGSTGIGANWTGVSRGYQYDTFLATELPQLLAAGYHASGRQVVAGVSTGGYTAYALAFQHPGEYKAAAAYSGLLAPELPVASQLVEALLVREGLNPLSLWGDPLFGVFTWLAHDPSDHVAALRGTSLFASSGNGLPGPLDPPGATVSAYDTTTLTDSQSFVVAANLAGVPLSTDFYGNGTHSWPYWNRELGRSMGMLDTGLGV